MSRIPITKDYAVAVGDWCEKVDNRSLLHEKFAFPKVWSEDVKENSASYWSIMRIATNGSVLLKQAAEKLAKPGHKVQLDKAEKMKDAAKVCEKLSNTKTGSNLEPLRPIHSERFIALLQQTYSENRLRVLNGRLEGRLAINLAEGLIQNAGITLDRIFGLPFIPGSAVKGVARAAALAEVKQNPQLFETFARVFGTAESDYQRNGELADFSCPDGLSKNIKGAITFIQATPVNDAKIVVDITTVHYPDYYRTGKPADEKNESPKPNHFPAVERGAEFAFPILLNSMSDDVKLLEAAERWLNIAMEQNGFGAKTAAGYGWFTDLTEEKRQKEKAEKQQQEAIEAQQRAEEEAKQREAERVAGLSPEEKIDELRARFAKLDDQPFSEKIKNIESLPEEEQRALIRLFSDKKKEKLKTWRKKKPEIVKPIETTAQKLGEPLP